MQSTVLTSHQMLCKICPWPDFFRRRRWYDGWTSRRWRGWAATSWPPAGPTSRSWTRGTWSAGTRVRRTNLETSNRKVLTWLHNSCCGRNYFVPKINTRLTRNRGFFYRFATKWWIFLLISCPISHMYSKCTNTSHTWIDIVYTNHKAKGWFLRRFHCEKSLVALSFEPVTFQPRSSSIYSLTFPTSCLSLVSKYVRWYHTCGMIIIRGFASVILLLWTKVIVYL